MSLGFLAEYRRVIMFQMSAILTQRALLPERAVVVRSSRQARPRRTKIDT
jgi:hypothetical protein